MERPTLKEIREHPFFNVDSTPEELPEYLLFRAPIDPKNVNDSFHLENHLLRVSAKKRKHDDVYIENGLLHKRAKY